MKKNEIIEQKSTEIIEKKTYEKPRGFEQGIDESDLVMPRTRLLQALSPEIKEKVDGYEIGDIINSLTGEKLPSEFIPIFMFKTYIKFNPEDRKHPDFNSNFEPRKVIWKFNNIAELNEEQLEDLKWINNEKPKALSIINFFSYFPDAPEMPVVISFAVTSYPAGKKLITLCRAYGGHVYSHKYKLSAMDETKDSHKFKILKVAKVGKPTPEEYNICNQLWETYSPKTHELQTEDLSINTDNDSEAPEL